MIEPFRPVVDLVAREHVSPNTRLSSVQRAGIRQVAFCGVSMDGRIMSLCDAVEASAVSLKTAVSSGSAKHLRLPVIIAPVHVDSVLE